ncbi:hypothetical protein CDAR_568211 [Caerostris darwini]|uniref:Uncharacterized protein n=1 Tax=Caerostris darwini TaxID=1538125 RepID=A0AAV4UTI9_9ARAC|nr:hypothetical protein CDAR_568211 [Caerostris darwini]
MSELKNSRDLAGNRYLNVTLSHMTYKLHSLYIEFEEMCGWMNSIILVTLNDIGMLNLWVIYDYVLALNLKKFEWSGELKNSRNFAWYWHVKSVIHMRLCTCIEFEEMSELKNSRDIARYRHV